MSAKTKCGLITLLLLGIAASWLTPSLVLAVHRTHAFSVCREFDSRGMINHEAVEEWRKRPGEEDYSILRRMQQIGGLDSHLRTLSWILTGVFAVNIFCVAMIGTGPTEAGPSGTANSTVRRPPPEGDIS